MTQCPLSLVGTDSASSHNKSLWRGPHITKWITGDEREGFGGGRAQNPRVVRVNDVGERDAVGVLNVWSRYPNYIAGFNFT